MNTTPLQDDIEATLVAGPLTPGELCQFLHTGVDSVRRALGALIERKRVRYFDKRNGSRLAHLVRHPAPTTGEST